MTKIYTTLDHVKKFLRSLPAKCIPKVTDIQEAKDLNTLSVVSNLKSHEIELNGDEHVKQFKTLALNYVRRCEKSSHTNEYKETTHDEASDEESDNDQKGCFNCQKPGHYIEIKKERFQRNNFKSKFKKSLMATCEELGNEE